jgi:endonuclease/exonuclease/phosphatase family metal-dependent hydrolase
MVLVSWNVAGRRSRLEDHAARVLELGPDLVCLQEVTPLTAGPWSASLADAGREVALLAAGSGPRRVVRTASATPSEPLTASGRRKRAGNGPAGAAATASTT